MFQHMADPSNHEAPAAGFAEPSPTAAKAAIARFQALSAEIRGCAILGPNGILAATGEHENWVGPAAELLAAADSAAGGTVSHAHVATEEGEAYALRQAGLAMVAVTDRFTLASLVLADMRAALRDLAFGILGEMPEAA